MYDTCGRYCVVGGWAVGLAGYRIGDLAAPQRGTVTISARWSRSRVIWFENYSGGWALYTFPLGRSARHLVWKGIAVLPDEGDSRVGGAFQNFGGVRAKQFWKSGHAQEFF